MLEEWIFASQEDHLGAHIIEVGSHVLFFASHGGVRVPIDEVVEDGICA